MTAAKKKKVPKEIGIGTAQGSKKGTHRAPSAAQVLWHRALCGPRRKSRNGSFYIHLDTILVFLPFQGRRNSSFLAKSAAVFWLGTMSLPKLKKTTQGEGREPKRDPRQPSARQ